MKKAKDKYPKSAVICSIPGVGALTALAVLMHRLWVTQQDFDPKYGMPIETAAA